MGPKPTSSTPKPQKTQTLNPNIDDALHCGHAAHAIHRSVQANSVGVGPHCNMKHMDFTCICISGNLFVCLYLCSFMCFMCLPISSLFIHIYSTCIPCCFINTECTSDTSVLDQNRGQTHLTKLQLVACLIRSRITLLPQRRRSWQAVRRISRGRNE